MEKLRKRITALALLWVIAAWAAFTGATEVVIARWARCEIAYPWLLAIRGSVLVVFALVLIAAPVEGALAITWLIGWWAIAAGAIGLVHAWNMHNEHRPQHRSVPPTRRHAAA